MTPHKALFNQKIWQINQIMAGEIAQIIKLFSFSSSFQVNVRKWSRLSEVLIGLIEN